MSTDTLTIWIGPAADPRPGLQIRAAQGHVLELANDLRAADALLGFPIQESLAVEVSAVLASTAGGIHGVAAVIRAFASRHAHRRVLLKTRDGDTIEVSGASPSEVQALLETLLTTLNEQQAEMRHLYEFPPQPSREKKERP